MSATCGNPDCPSQWCDLPCTCNPVACQLEECASAGIGRHFHKGNAAIELVPVSEPGEDAARITTVCGKPEVHCAHQYNLDADPQPYWCWGDANPGYVFGGPVSTPVAEIGPESGHELFVPGTAVTLKAPESWFCGIHGQERTGPVGMCTCETPELTPEQSLLVALTEIITEAQHAPECYITPDETTCHCLIGKVKAVLPMCTETRNAYGGPAEVQRMGEEPQPYWRCVLIEHPDNPDKHHFEDV